MARDNTKELAERRPRFHQRADLHARRYQATEGAEGYDDNSHGAPTLLLYTRGHRSGKEVTTPLYFAEQDGRYIVIASYGGADVDPDWYRNLEVNPNVEVQIRGDRFPATARTASAEEKRELWPLMAGPYPFYDDYQKGTERDIPVVILQRSA